VEPLIGAYQDKEYESFIDAIWALGDIGGTRAEEILVQALNYQGYHPYVTNIAAKCLTKLGWEPANREQKIRYLIALEKWEQAIKSGPSASLKPAGTNQAEGPFELNIPIVIPLEAEKQTPAVAKCPWLQFSTAQGKLKAALDIQYSSWPHTKWVMKIDVLDADGTVLGQAKSIHSNSGIIKKYILVENAEIIFGFDRRVELTDAARFRFSIESFWTSQGNPIQFDKELPLVLELNSAEQSRTIKAKRLKFQKNGDRVEGTIHLDYLSWPKAKWKVDVSLLDENGTPLTGHTAIIENSGRIIGRPIMTMKDFRFSLWKWGGVSKAVRYGITMQRMLDSTAKTDVQVEGEKTSQSQFSKTLPNGITVELAGILEFSDGKVQSCWKPDGIPFDEPIHVKYGPKYDHKVFGFVFNTDIPSEITKFDVKGTMDRLGSAAVVDANDRLTELTQQKKQHIKLLKLAESDTTEISLSIAPEWKSSTQYDGKYIIGRKNPKIKFLETYESGDNLKVVFSHEYVRTDFRLQAYLTQDATERLRNTPGRTYLYRREGQLSTVYTPEGIKRTSALFEGLKLSDIKYFTLYIRPKSNQVKFSNVPLHPIDKTDVQLEVEQSSSESGGDGIVVVSAGKSTMYRSIPEAVAAAPAGSVIRVGAGAGVYGERPELEVEQRSEASEATSATLTVPEVAKTRGGISGIVVSSVTGKPIAGAYVGVGDFGDSGGSNYSRHRSQGFHDKTKTDEKGRFELGGLVFTDKHRDLEYHPLVVTHPDFVRHDEKIEMLSSGPVPDVKVSLRPAAKIDVTIVDAQGNPLQGQWLIRLEALDGRRFIPPGSDPHLSSFASSIWAHMPDLRANMGVSNGFTFTELDSGQYSIEAIRFHLVDKPTPQNIWKPTITYHGSIPSLKIEAGRTKQVKLAPQDHQTRLTITPPEFPDKLMDKLERSSRMPLMCLISRSPGTMLWADGKIHHLEDQRLGRIDKKRFFRGFFLQGKPLTINNLPPDSYSLFAMAVYGQVAGCLIGARADLAKGDNVTLDIPWRQPTGPSMVGPNRSFDYPVNLEAGDYSVSELCEILTSITQSNPRLIADSSIENEKLSFGKGQMPVWDVLEKLYLDKEWTVDEGAEKTLIIKPAEQTDMSIEDKGTEAVSAESQVKPAAGQDGPGITFESLVCDLGQIEPKTKHVFEFKFTNTGNEVLTITRVRTPCACTVPKLKKKEYAPGESGTLKVTYQSAARAGPVKKYVFVQCNDKVNPSVKLAIKVEIVIKVAHEPKKLDLLLDKENAGCPAITLTSLDNQPFSITGFKSTGDSITADFDPLMKKTSFVIQPKADMEKLRTGLKGNIEISLTHPECKKVTIIFDTLTEFKVDPRVIYIREAVPQKPVTKTVSILSNYNEDVEIESTSSKKGTVKVLTKEKVLNGCQFELEITPPVVPETKRRVFTDTFTVKLKGGQQLQITCYGIYSKKPSKTG
ncbi:MAG: DUF1573 domain-containing protein, partial [Planctomycetota bacterium]